MKARFASMTTLGEERDEICDDPVPVFHPALTIVSHTQASRAGQRAFLFRNRPMSLSRTEPDFSLPGQTWGLPLDDPYISRKPIVLQEMNNDTVRLDNTGGSKRLLVDGKPVNGEIVFDKAQLKKGIFLDLAGRAGLLLHLANLKAEPIPKQSPLIGTSDAVANLRSEIARVADLSVPVLLRGASGTGKELAAEAIAAGQKRGAPFVSVNMAAIPPELAASELFGSVRGAFTGADRDRAGFFGLAHEGTLFMDEIGETPVQIQPLLLRALESGEIQSVGGRETRRVKVRVVAATDANLEDLVARDLFRAPLLHRLSGYEIRLPTLAQRPEDVGLLFYHFARSILNELGSIHLLEPEDPYATPWLPPALAMRLVHFSWPGNVRQLRNFAHRLIIANRGRAVLQITQQLEGFFHEKPVSEMAVRSAFEIKESDLMEALAENRYDIKATAQALGISRTSLYRKIEKYPGIPKASDLDWETLNEVFQRCEGNVEAMVDELRVSASALRRRIRDLGITR